MQHTHAMTGSIRCSNRGLPLWQALQGSLKPRERQALKSAHVDALDMQHCCMSCKAYEQRKPIEKNLWSLCNVRIMELVKLLNGRETKIHNAKNVDVRLQAVELEPRGGHHCNVECTLGSNMVRWDVGMS